MQRCRSAKRWVGGGRCGCERALSAWVAWSLSLSLCVCVCVCVRSHRRRRHSTAHGYHRHFVTTCVFVWVLLCVLCWHDKPKTPHLNDETWHSSCPIAPWTIGPWLLRNVNLEVAGIADRSVSVSMTLSDLERRDGRVRFFSRIYVTHARTV